MLAAVSPPLCRLADDVRNWARWVRATDTKLGFPPHACIGDYLHSKEDAEDWPKWTRATS